MVEWSKSVGVHSVRVSERHVRDHIPLEQGLRLTKDAVEHLKADVRDHIPLEQGLRPVSCLCLLKLQLKHWSSIHQNKD